MTSGVRIEDPSYAAGSLCRTLDMFVAFLVLLALGLHPSVGHAQNTVVLVGSGSSVPSPLYAEFSQTYNKRNAKIQMRYLPMSTAEGISQISKGSGDFAAGEVPLSAKERGESNLIELPSALIGIVPIYNLPGIKKELRFSGELLAEIFLGQVKTWNSRLIAKLNPDITLPNLPIKVIYRPGGKGSNYIFTDFLSKTSAKFHAEIGAHPSPKWPVGVPAERSSDMADKVKKEAGAIGYVEAQYAVQAGIPYGAVLNPAGHYIKASPETIKAACQAVEAPEWDRFSASLTNSAGANAYPITSFTWFYLRTVSSDSKRSAAMGDLLSWVYSDGQPVTMTQGYAELPPPLLAKVKMKVASLH
jgi:phosphate transport system substrate-binding protein